GLEETREMVATANAAAVEAVANMSTEAARAMQAGIAESLRKINEEFDRFTTAMRGSETSLLAQANAIREATSQSGAVADAFARTAQDVRVASVPLVQSSERIAGATESMTETVARSVAALEAGQASSRQLAEALVGHMDHLSTLWAGYEKRFEGVDEDLAAAIEQLAKATRDQGDMLATYAGKVDEGLASALDKLNPLLSGLHDNTEDLGDAVGDLRRVLMPHAAE